MQIVQTRIRNLNKYSHFLKDGASIMLSVPLSQISAAKLKTIGFDEVEPGNTVLPSPLGPVSDFNANGKDIIHKDQPKETAYRQAEWRWVEFRGRYDSEEKSKIVDIPYQRYPRTFVPPPSIELTVRLDVAGSKRLVSGPFKYASDDIYLLVHSINVFLEIFGFCDVLNEELESVLNVPVCRLNWDILPRGKKSWDQLKPLLDRKLTNLPEAVRVVVDKRFESINVHFPEFVAVGRAGFAGYLVFGFPNRGLYILESTQTNNATYVFDSDWEILSSMSKMDILSGRLQKGRIYHRQSWFSKIHELLS